MISLFDDKGHRIVIKTVRNAYVNIYSYTGTLDILEVSFISNR